MPLNWWRSLAKRESDLGHQRRRAPRKCGRLQTSRLQVEALEERTLLSFSGLDHVVPLTVAHPAVYARPLHELFHPPDGVVPLGSSGPVGLEPNQIRHAYQFDQIMFGAIQGDGTGQTIAIVDAYDNPDIATDLASFDSILGVPAPPSFTKVAQDGSTNYPPPNPGWATEIDLDVEWSHAIAPGANILLVEAFDSSFANLNTAVDYARHQAGVSVVSMSYGAGEFLGETAYDGFFTTPSGHAGVTFVSASGDSGAPPEYQAISPNVLAAGGTTLTINSSNNWVNETGWAGSGGGISVYESQPAYQNGVVSQWSTTQRTNPDVAFDADPNSGVAVYDAYNNGTAAPWEQVGGTSFSSPAWAALIAIADQGRILGGLRTLDGPTGTLPLLYQLPGSDFHDITVGNNGYPAGPGYDLVTGRGSPIANLVVAGLTGQQGTTDTWTGGGANSNWSNASNWASGVAPNSGDNLVFGPGASQSTTTNDLAAGTQFGTISLTSTGYTISGNNIMLGGGLDGSAATGSNTFSLNVTLTGNETFKIGSGSTVLTMGGNINNGGYLVTIGGGNGSGVLSGVISGGGGLTDNNTGTVTLAGSAANTYTGATTVQSGTLVLSDSAGTAVPGSLTINAGSNVVRLLASSQTASTAAVTVNRSATLNLNGNADAIGALTLSNGTVTTGAGTLTLNGNLTESGTATISGNLALSGSETFTVSSSSTLTLSALTSGTGGFTKAGAGILVVSGSNTYSGGTVQSAGTLAVGNASALGTGALSLNGGTIRANGAAVSLANAVTLGGGVTIAGSLNLTFTGAVTLTRSLSLTVNNTGITTFAGTIGQSGGSFSLGKGGARTLVLTGANTYSGGTTVGTGTLVVGNNSALGTGGLILGANTTIRASGGAVTLANGVVLGNGVTFGGSYDLTFTGTVTMGGNRTVTVSNTGITTFAGAVRQSGGTFSLTKAGTGTLVLSGTDTYAGGTIVNAGTLLITGSVASGTVTVNNGGTLGGSGTVGPITVASGGTVMPGTSSSTTGILSTGNVALNSGATFNIALNGTTAGSGYDQLNVTGTVNLGSSTLNVSLGFTPAVGTTFTIIRNHGTNPIVGTFNGLPEGAILLINGMTFQISYVGGTGNDVVLSRIS